MWDCQSINQSSIRLLQKNIPSDTDPGGIVLCVEGRKGWIEETEIDH